MRVLNAYAGIGGNRHLWPREWSVTAVELDGCVASEYARRYPHDEVIVGDAHELLMSCCRQFDAVWSSPVCKTHSRLNRAMPGHGAPDPSLMEEVRQLRGAGICFVVENVHAYYRPELLPDLVTDRHWYWASAVPLALPTFSVRSLVASASASQLARSYGLPPVPKNSGFDAREALRNAVVPLEGLLVAQAAFQPESVLSG